MGFKSGGTFKLCFCDSSLLADGVCMTEKDYKIEVGTIHASGVSCLIADPKLQRVSCPPQAHGGLRCYEHMDAPTPEAPQIGISVGPPVPGHRRLPVHRPPPQEGLGRRLRPRGELHSIAALCRWSATCARGVGFSARAGRCRAAGLAASCAGSAAACSEANVFLKNTLLQLAARPPAASSARPWRSRMFFLFRPAAQEGLRSWEKRGAQTLSRTIFGWPRLSPG